MNCPASASVLSLFGWEKQVSCCQPRVPWFPLRDSMSQTIQKVWASRLQCLGWGHNPTRKWLFSLPTRRFMKLTKPSLLYPFNVRKNIRSEKVYRQQVTPITTGSHWLPKDESWLYFLPLHLLHFIIWVLNFKIDVLFWSHEYSLIFFLLFFSSFAILSIIFFSS